LKIHQTANVLDIDFTFKVFEKRNENHIFSRNVFESRILKSFTRSIRVDLISETVWA